MRFGGIADIWNQIHEPGGPEWVDYLKAQKAAGVTFDPTFNIYSASRDLMRAKNADWHAHIRAAVDDRVSTNRTATTTAAISSTGRRRARSAGAISMAATCG